MKIPYSEITAFAFGLVISAAGLFTYLDTWPHFDNHTHYDEEVHVHADFVIYIDDQKIDLSSEQYQSSTEQLLHEDVHLHDGDDHVVHRHAEGITFAEFLHSLGYQLTNNCLTTDTEDRYCADDENVLRLYVNGAVVQDKVSYIPQEENRILLYYGTPDNVNLQSYLESITNESCIYSGTCPERGTAPPESCGLTCEL